MFILKESVRYRLIVPFTLEGEPMAPADAMAGLHTEVFQSLKIPCVQDRGYMFLEIGEKSVLEDEATVRNLLLQFVIFFDRII